MYIHIALYTYLYIYTNSQLNCVSIIPKAMKLHASFAHTFRPRASRGPSSRSPRVWALPPVRALRPLPSPQPRRHVMISRKPHRVTPENQWVTIPAMWRCVEVKDWKRWLFKASQISSGKHTKSYWKWPMYSGFSHEKWWFSIANCQFADDLLVPCRHGRRPSFFFEGSRPGGLKGYLQS